MSRLTDEQDLTAQQDALTALGVTRRVPKGIPCDTAGVDDGRRFSAGLAHRNRFGLRDGTTGIPASVPRLL